MPNSTHRNSDNLWYFWDDSGSIEYGPYLSEAEAEDECDRFIDDVLNEKLNIDQRLNSDLECFGEQT